MNTDKEANDTHELRLYESYNVCIPLESKNNKTFNISIMHRLGSLVLLLILLMGCSKQESPDIPEHLTGLKNLTVFPADAKPDMDIRLVREQSFGSSDEVLIGSIGDIAVDESGQVFIADAKKNTIHVFGPHAHYLTHIGRKGKGPGEFYRIKDLQIKDRKLFAYDLTRFRYNVFSLDSLSFRYTVNLGNNRNDFKELSGANQKSGYVRNNSTFLAVFTQNFHEGNDDWDKMETRGLYYLLNKDGNITSQKLLELKNKMHVLVPFQGGATSPQGHHTTIRRMGYHPGFYGKSLTVLADNNHIFRAWTNTFLIKEYSPEGKYQRAIYYPFKKMPLTRESATDAGTPDYILKGWNSMDLPQIWPALNDMKIDDQNRLWISTVVSDMDKYQWWVLDNQGRLLARFEWPRRKQIEVIKNGFVYTKEPRKKAGIKQVIRYKIRINQ